MTRILVIEDDPSVTTLLIDLLEHEGYEVATAADGLEGLFKIRNAGVDAALLDVMMPDIDGSRVLRQLHEEHDGGLPFPILVLTGSPEGARRCRELLGADRVIDKPFDPMVLLDRLRAVLGSDHPGGPTS
ncbi:MAG: response regulator transcription factor [Nitriliruptor sp.]